MSKIRPMTITEKILAAHSGAKQVEPDQFIEADVDICLANDVTAPLAIKEFEATGAKKVFDARKIVLIPDHFLPARDVKSAEQAKVMREFAQKYKLKHYYEIGRCGIEHAFLPEQGIVLPGQLIIGADSHTCTYGALGAFATGVGSTDAAACMATGKVWLRVPHTISVTFEGKLPKWVGGKDLILYLIGQIGVSGATYRSMEARGAAIESLPMDDRLAFCNMAIEAGGKNGVIAPDAITQAYVSETAPGTKYKTYASDAAATYLESCTYDVSGLSPLVAAPHSPANVKPVQEFSKVTIDQVVVGSCTNGRISDLREAARLLRGHKVHPNVRMIVFPATQKIFQEAMKEGLLNLFVEAGAAVSTPTCGPCLGGHMGCLAAGERALATTNRNFVGRMGHTQSEVYLCNPAVAAASAITGRITHPSEIIK
jgi:3-isopropylmalate/(R)-2-methylmalate dehydratase large subunit